MSEAICGVRGSKDPDIASLIRATVSTVWLLAAYSARLSLLVGSVAWVMVSVCLWSIRRWIGA